MWSGFLRLWSTSAQDWCVTNSLFDLFTSKKGISVMYRFIMNFTFRRRLLILPALLFMLFTMSFGAGNAKAATTSPQTNTTHCQSLGSLIESDPILFGTTKIGELDVYYNSSTGYNCAYLWHSGPSWGVSKYTDVEIVTCQQTSPSAQCSPVLSDDADGGNYAYDAGPAGVYGRGHCISFNSEIEWTGGLYEANRWGASHCS